MDEFYGNLRLLGNFEQLSVEDIEITLGIEYSMESPHSVLTTAKV
jgi:hypothetical protein